MIIVTGYLVLIGLTGYIGLIEKSDRRTMGASVFYGGSVRLHVFRIGWRQGTFFLRGCDLERLQIFGNISVFAAI